MKVIHEKNYVYAGINEDWHVFKTNPNKVNFDPEIIYVKRARLVLEDGRCIFFDEFDTRSTSPVTIQGYMSYVK